jgi:hypothetical protein
MNDEAIEAEKLYRIQQLSWAEQGKIAEAEATLIRNSNRRVNCAIHQKIDEMIKTEGIPNAYFRSFLRLATHGRNRKKVASHSRTFQIIKWLSFIPRHPVIKVLKPFFLPDRIR